MDDAQRRTELAHFLRTRRERLLPVQVHLPEGRGRRRTPGLRREELAYIADVSLSWYLKLEQGQAIQVSAQVLESLARALQLTADERAYLFVLARQELPLPALTTTPQVSVEQQRVLDSFYPNPAFVVNEHWDVIGRNRATARVFTRHLTLTSRDRNLLWFMFTHPEARRQYVQWDTVAQSMLALFRMSEGRYGEDAWFIERRDQLIQASAEFRLWWMKHEVGGVHLRRKELDHPLVGRLVLQSTTLLVADNPGLRVHLHTPLPEADTASKLMQLATVP